MKRIIITLLLVGITITSNAQFVKQTDQRKTIDSLNTVIRLLRWQSNRDSINIATLTAQSSANVKTITAFNARLSALENGRLSIDTKTMDTTGGLLKVRPVDFSPVTNSIKILQDQVNNIPVIDAIKLQAWYDWLALAKISFTNLSK